MLCKYYYRCDKPKRRRTRPSSTSRSRHSTTPSTNSSSTPSNPSACSSCRQNKKTKVPIESQRLLYRGFVIDLEKTLADYRIEEGNIIQLVANKIPSEHSNQSSLRRTEINKAHSYQKEHNKSKRFRQLQERMNGFRLKKEESLEVLKQNKHTIDQLIDCLNHNFMQDVSPFKMDRRKLEIGEWVDVRDASGQWVEGQVINEYGEYVLIHYNGWDNRWNEWVSASSERIMPFRAYTVQMVDKTSYMSPFPAYERQIGSSNPKFKANIQSLAHELTSTLDNINNLLKEMEFSHNEEADESLKNVSNMSIPQIVHNGSVQENMIEEIDEGERKEESETPNKENHLVGDNLSNKCEDDRSNKCDNDDISNKSYKSKRSEGLVDTSSMKSLIIDQSRKRQNKVFFDHTEEVQSVRSVKNKKSQKNVHIVNQEEYILEEDSQYNQQDFEDSDLARKKELKRKMKASQLAPLLDRMGRFLIDIAPHFALLGYTDQTNAASFNENLSTYTNEGSLLSKISQVKKQVLGMSNNLTHSHNLTNHQMHKTASIEEPYQIQKPVNAFCAFQVPVMLTPNEVINLQKVIELEKRNLQLL